MGIVHQQGDPRLPAHLCQGSHVRASSQVVRSRDVNRKGRRFFLFQGLPQALRRDLAGTEAVPFLRPQPYRLQPQKTAALDKGLVGIPARQDPEIRPRLPVEQGQVKHGLDALGASSGTVKGMPAVKQLSGIPLAFFYDPIRGRQVVCPGDLRDIKTFKSKGASALMSRHMQALDPAVPIAADKIPDRRFHSFYSSALRAACSMMAHSIRFLKSSQPYLYTPWMDPVAW